MLSRRALVVGAPVAALAFGTRLSCAQTAEPVIGTEVGFYQLPLPPLASLDDQEVYGYNKPTADQLARAQKIVDETPKGPRPYDVAKSFIDRFSQTDPDAIAQWPAPAAWNPLVKGFFDATSLRVKDDMVNWCAAFVNWCIARNNMKGTDSASSQTFITSGKFSSTDTPSRGDLVVFTCYDKQSGKSLGLGHVAFFEEDLGGSKIRVIGGNQSADGHSSIISRRDFSTKPFDSHRHVGDEYVACTFSLNKYLKVA